MTAHDRAVRLKALTELALATRERVEKQTFDVYLEDTAHIETIVLVEACRRARKVLDWFPKVKELIEVCSMVTRDRADEIARTRPRLSPPEEPSPARVQMWLERIKAASQGRKVAGFSSTREAFDPKLAATGERE